MLHDWIRVALEAGVQVAFAILPAAPLLGLKLPSITEEKGFSAESPHYRQL
jgi:hypothetical protein